MVPGSDGDSVGEFSPHKGLSHSRAAEKLKVESEKSKLKKYNRIQPSWISLLQSDSLLLTFFLWRFDQLHLSVARAVKHHQLALRIAENKNVTVAKVCLFDRFFQCHRTQRYGIG